MLEAAYYSGVAVCCGSAATIGHVAIPQSFLQDLIARADLVELIGRHVQLRKTGANYSGLCPFHAEKSPSFSVSPTKQFFHCFGCAKSGNAIGFLTDYLGLGFVDAVKDLAHQYGMQVPDDDSTPQERARFAEQRKQQATLHDVLEKAADAYRRQLKNAPQAIDYLKRRGVSGLTAKRFGLGYAPAGWNHLAGVFPSYDDPLLVESGLVIQPDDESDPEHTRRYDRFRDRLMFPIRNPKGETIGFGARVFGDEKPKYLNSPETPVFSKGRELYGLFEAHAAVREAGVALVTEGYMDVIALAQHGFAHSVATLGTACTTDHVRTLFRVTDAVVFAFDGDAAGRRAARKALEAALPFATDLRSIKFLFLPSEHDPDSYVREHGREGFARAVAEATPLSRQLLEVAREGCDLSQAEGRARMAAQAKGLWLPLPDGALKRQLLAEIAERVELGGHELTELWGLQQRTVGKSSSSYSNNSDKRSSDGRRSGFSSSNEGRRARSAPASRADHAVRLLLGSPALWDGLSGEDHELLSALPGAHGPLFAWLESQVHEHGPQPWGALREGLRGHDSEALALKQMSAELAAAAPEEATELDTAPAVQPDGQLDVLAGAMADAQAQAAQAAEAAAELRDLLDRMLNEHLMDQETEALAAASTDPAAIDRYRMINARRLSLKSAVPKR